ncbi:MAG: outer membrane beta-barrel protein [Burkholderiaceae bacterium]|nr:outer membrane beta-barrel protein [Burkholderiaceae bacterium]
MIKKIAAAAALAVLATSTFAAEPAGVYAGLDVGSTKLDDLSGRKTSVGGFVGYQFNETFAVEGGYRRLASFTDSGVDVKANQAAVSVIASLPVTAGIKVFGRLGYNRLEAKASAGRGSFSDSTSSAVYGVGASFDVSPVVAVRAEWQRPSSDSNNLSLGVSYKF